MGELPELKELEELIALSGGLLRSRIACEVRVRDRQFPVPVLSLGSEDPQAPAVGFFGGVHGLERIGAEVVLAYLRSLVMRLSWDETLRQQLRELHLVFMPLVNPGGIWLRTRANPRGVDLMRNAPVEAIEKVPFMIGGQRYSAGLPWYRGARESMEAESAALCALVEEELLQRPFALTLDCHSGFGTQDRLWFPYAHTRRPIAHLPELEALRAIFAQSYAHHQYVFEPQSCQYLTHGDLWDYLYLRAGANSERVFLPLTLEMGSWLWVKKNPRQMFSRFGIFNPLIAHRQQRVMRRHLALLDFFTRAAASWRQWLPQGEARELHRAQALARWYRDQLA
ncbi:Zinc carboxypeptidase [Solimonas aquatica]|uniref:Zinc carboxypeptidase n=1 Tax=Solimonas aquatica TaxID=489703 RepID=A0A1H9LR89_9GAMM|nr:M14 family zinc carboxypeptidase [Solimonas aquatica]SER13936.1 Zinc carboxypeptidase [Solimonas aquatica]